MGDVTAFPLTYWALAYKPDGKCYRVLVTVGASGARSRSEWTEHVYPSVRVARRDVEEHNKRLKDHDAACGPGCDCETEVR